MDLLIATINIAFIFLASCFADRKHQVHLCFHMEWAGSCSFGSPVSTFCVLLHIGMEGILKTHFDLRENQKH